MIPGAFGYLSYNKVKLHLVKYYCPLRRDTWRTAHRIFIAVSRFVWIDKKTKDSVEVKLWREKQIGFGDDELVEWLLLLEAGENEGIRKELEVRAMDNPALQEAMEKWEDLSRDPAAIREYEVRHKAMMDRLSAMAENERRQQQKWQGCQLQKSNNFIKANKVRESFVLMMAQGIMQSVCWLWDFAL